MDIYKENIQSDSIYVKIEKTVRQKYVNRLDFITSFTIYGETWGNFKVGPRTWKRGKIVAKMEIWSPGLPSPYTFQLQNGQKICVPMDDDAIVRPVEDDDKPSRRWMFVQLEPIFALVRPQICVMYEN